MSETVLTGIKPTGVPHLGNYVGAIRPALERAARASGSFFFIADLHALNQVQDSATFRHLGNCVAATWLSSGLDPSRSYFYRQSDVPEVFELATILAAFTPKGWLNKSHAYKAAVAANLEKGADEDAGVNMGLYTYPILMAADILLFDTDIVPVGRDQIQHVEVTRDIAQRINQHYDCEVLKLPKAEITNDAEAIPGLDGRKMSKSYGNDIPAFASEKTWKQLIGSILTDSSDRSAPKDPDTSAVYAIYASLCTPHERAEMRENLAEGALGWGDAKQMLFKLVQREMGAGAAEFTRLMSSHDEINDILLDGASEVRVHAQATLDRVREAVGLARRGRTTS